MLWHFVFLRQITNAYNEVLVLLNFRTTFTHTQTFVKSTFILFVENLEVVMCCIQSKVVRVNQISTPLSPRETQRVSHLIFSRTFCTIEKRGNSGNAQRKTFFFQEVFPGVRAQWDFKNCLEELADMLFYVKLNFKLGLFSSTFWFEHSLRSENAYL